MDPALIAILVAAIGPLVTYLIAARRFSGQIETTEAKELWEESRSIREWSRQRINDLNKRVSDLERELRTCQAALAESNRLREEERRGR